MNTSGFMSHKMKLSTFQEILFKRTYSCYHSPFFFIFMTDSNDWLQKVEHMDVMFAAKNLKGIYERKSTF